MSVTPETRTDEPTETSPAMREVRYEYTPRLAEILTQLQASILVTTYQAGKLLVLGAHQGRLSISFLDYDQPMGLAVSPRRIAVGTRRQMHFLVPAHQTQAADSPHDGCFVPRSSFYTGSIHGHDLGWGQDGLWIVNTLFSCLSTLHDEFSFVPQWRPPFISRLIDQDRCHLNGMAIDGGRPRFVTAMSETDTAAGWRAHKATSGVVMEVPSGQVLCGGLSMPHSPRVYAGRLCVLNSGYGSFGWIEPQTGRYQALASMPGYTRGLAFCGQYAFVGLSKIRETSVFGGVPIAEHRDELRCGVGVIDITNGQTVAVFQFHSGVSEIFAVEVLPGFVNPLIAGASIDQQEREVWIVPEESTERPRSTSRPPIFAAEMPADSHPAPIAQLESSIGSRPSTGDLVVAAQNFHAQGQLELAVHSYEAAIVAHPQPAPLLVDLGNVRQDQGNQPAALLCYQRALDADPNCVVALQNLGYLLFNMGEAEKAHDVYERLIALNPSPLNRLLASSVLPVVYDSAADVQYWRTRQIEILQQLLRSGGTIDASETLVPTAFFAAYQGLCDRELMALRGQAIKGRDFTAGRRLAPTGKLRVGFISAYFREHTIGRLNIQRLEHLSRQHIELTVIQAGTAHDQLAQRYARTADRYVQLSRSLPQAAAELTALHLDVLVHADVGMDALTQTLAYSRFAPVQVATWGHPDTTGSPMIDYFISSRHLERVDGQEDYTEKLVLLDWLGIDYEKPGLPEPLGGAGGWHGARERLGLPTDKHVYCCPQTLFKFHPDFDEILARILELDPLAELVLLAGRLPEWTHRLRRRFRRTLPQQGARVRFLPALARPDFLTLLAISDVVLDPIHFGGGNSSLETIAMGVPLVTIEGHHLRSRITSAIYRQIGYTELIASDGANYADLAARIASDRHFREQIVERLRAAAEGLFSDHSAARQLEHALLQMSDYNRN